MKYPSDRMRVRFLDSTVTAHDSFRGGKEYEVPQSDGLNYLRWGVAVEAEEPQAAQEPAEPETLSESDLKVTRKRKSKAE